ncbi:MAG TPA: hypothetical protein VN884_11680 [Candidatus Sulfotelmatobacter sp.]|nr:hypothetical protein [Candidatus Sulfotelmatobacter sp.]
MRVVDPLMLPEAALIVLVPAATAVANPLALIVATVVVCEVHVAVLVKFCVELSEKVPVAVNCSVAVIAIVGFAGVTAIDTSVGAVTVSVVEPLMAPEVALIVLVPAATPVANPPAVIVATVVVDELHVAVLVKFCVELSEKVPVAVNCSVAPLAMEGFAGVTAIDTSVGPVTVSVVEPLMAPEVALIALVPAATPVASPPAVIVATVVVEELHVAVLVKFCVELSENVPVAVNCSVALFAMEGFAGVTAIDTSVGAVTVSVVEPLMAPEVALIVLVPAATPVANPPAVIVATAVVDELHVAVLVKFCVELSEKVPVAVNCSVALFAMEGFAGVTAIDTSVGAVTVSVVEPLMAPEVALIVLVPVATPVANPPVVIVATVVVEELHVAVLVKFCVELSEKVPVAVNCSVAPFAMEEFAGVTVIDTSVAEVTVRIVEPLMAPEAALIVLVPAATPVASPPAVIVATLAVCEVHIAVLVKFCVELSEKVPVAVNCRVVPLAMEGLAGVTAIDTSVGAVAVTVRVVEPLMAPEAALMVLVPAATPVANPPALIVATPVVCEVQVAVLVRF